MSAAVPMPPSPRPLLLLVLLALLPTFGSPCNNLALKDLSVRSCDPQSRMRNYDVTATLTKDCNLNFRACFNVTRMINQSKINYRVVKSPFSPSGSLDGCKEVEKLCADEAKRVGVTCEATRAQSGPNKQKQKRNKFAPLKCPQRPGRRCIADAVNVDIIKKLGSQAVGPFQVTANVDHGDAGSSCLMANFTLARTRNNG